jgi:hypothetical protein
VGNKALHPVGLALRVSPIVVKLASFKHSSLLQQLVIYYFKNVMVLVSVGATFVQKLVLQLFLLIQNLKFVKVHFHFNLFICQSAINIQNIRTKGVEPIS